MLIPLIPKDPDANDFTCRDGEIEWISEEAEEGNGSGEGASASASPAHGIRFSLTPEGTYPSFNVRIPLQAGDDEKVRLMLAGEISRVDAATADRVTSAILLKTAEAFSQTVIDNRRLGLHLLPFRVYCVVRSADGSRGEPGAQAVMLPSETPPHPEITARSVTADTLTLSLRIPVVPCRLVVNIPDGACASDVQTFVSYPVFLPPVDEVTGNLGSVISASGGTAMGVRFAFLSISSMKASVAAPEKYYRLYGNPQTGYRLSSRAAPAPDYSIYARIYGVTPPYPLASLVARGSGVDPFDWIADWEKTGDGCLPLSLPYSCRSAAVASALPAIPASADAGLASKIMESTGWRNMLLTRPMTFSTAEKSRRAAVPKSVGTLEVLGLCGAKAVAVLFGSDDGVTYEPLRIFDPYVSRHMLAPHRLFHRLLIVSSAPFGAMALKIE